MRRNVHNTYDTVRSNHNKLTVNGQNTLNIMDMLRDIKEELKQFTFYIRMNSVDVSDFFPLKNDKDLALFLDKSHEDWERRRRGFHHLLFTTVTKNKRRFSTALLHTVFTRDFISNHTWPHSGYICLRTQDCPKILLPDRLFHYAIVKESVG